MKNIYSSFGAGHHLATGTIKIFLAEALILPTGFITTIFLARTLGPMSYGLFALASVLVLWVEWAGSALYTHATIKFISENSDWEPIGTGAIQIHFVTGILIAILLWFLSTPLSRMFNEPLMADYLRIYSVDIPVFTMARAYCNILIGTGHFKERALVSAARKFARLLLVILLVGIGLSVQGAIIGMIGASIVEFLICRFYIRLPLFCKPTFPIQNFLAFAAPLFLSSLSLSIFRLDLLALKILSCTASVVGFYGVARNLSIPITLFSGSFSPSLLATLSNLLRNGKDEKAKEIANISIRFNIHLVPFAAIIAGASGEIIFLIFGDQYMPADKILSVLIFAALALLSMNVSKSILTALDKPVWVLALSGSIVPIALIGYLILIPLLGGLGAAIVTASVSSLGAIASIFSVYLVWNIFPGIKTLMTSLFCSVLAYLLALSWPVSGIFIIPKLTIIILIIVLIYWLFGELTSSDIAMFRSLFQTRQTKTIEHT
ncbi:MAG: oligosaccharide flippase family protein [Deltaproteobacteria bacterium]|nr:oligosaccharide flippase family protein [Deltaproteobacteria bacterium]